MPQVMDKRDIQPISDSLSDAFDLVACFAEPLIRSLKRLFGEKITPNDYNALWAEINEDGSVVCNSQKDAPDLVLYARRIPNTDEWRITKEKRKILYTPSYTLANVDGSISISYEELEDLGNLSTDELQALMTRVDPKPRSAPSHYTRAFN